MGARITEREPENVARPGVVLLALVVLLGTGLAGCGVDADDAAARRAETLDHAERVIRQDIDDLFARAASALSATEEASAEIDDPDRMFAALEDARRRSGVDGVELEEPQGDGAWAGRTLARKPLPAGPPWARSFESGEVRYHQGPFIRAFQIARNLADGSTAYATSILEEERPGDASTEPFERRWVEPLGLRSVEIVPAELAQSVPPDETGRRLIVFEASNEEAAFGVFLHAIGPEATRERMVADRDALTGSLLLLLLAAAVASGLVGIRRIRRKSVRCALLAGLIILTRQALVWIDLRRFDSLSAEFSPDLFSVATPLGWLASPGDFALSAIVYLLVAICMIQAPGSRTAFRGAARRTLAVASPFLVALVAWAWSWLVDHAVFGGQTSFFDLSAIVPAASTTLMLAALVTCTAAAYLLCAWLIRAGTGLLPERLGLLRPILPAILGAGLAGLFAASGESPGWAVALLPLVSAITAGAPGAGGRIALPSRILIVSVLATVILFPLLWLGLELRDRERLPSRLEELVEREQLARDVLETTLTLFSVEPYVQAELRRTSEGFTPDGIALSLWMRSGFRQRGDPGVVSILDADGRLKDQFALEAIPLNLVPPAAAQPGDRADVDVEIVRTDLARTVVGRLRVRDDDTGDVLGYVVIALPSLVDLVLLDLVDAVASPTAAPDHALRQFHGLQVATIRDGRVVATNDPTVSRREGGFGPAELASIPDTQPTLSWSGGGFDGYARWSPAHSAVIAVRRTNPDFADVLLALARIVVVGVGLGLIVALLFAVRTLRGFRPRLQHKILLSYLVISVLPLLLLGGASAREAQVRFDSEMTDRLHLDVARVRHFMERLGVRLFDRATSQTLARWAADERHDVLLYRHGTLESASRFGLADAELLAPRLPPDVYRATVLEARETIRPAALYGGREAWIGYAPILDGRGRVRATVAVPLGYDRERMQAEVTVTGSALLAGYLLALVVVLVAGIYAARGISRPIAVLASGTKRVASGELDVELPGEGEDELGELVRSFNTMTRELRDATDRAVRAEREAAWRRMARQVAHEIRNPLTPMRLMIQQLDAVLERDPSAAQAAIRETTPVLLRQITALQEIAGDFANFARLPTRDVARVDVGALVEHVTALHQGAEGIVVEREIEPGLSPVLWDEEELRRVLLNLVGNAVQAVPGKGVVKVRVSKALRDDVDGVRISVSDDGIGIPDEDRPRLFEPHFSTKTSGTGLGLAIVGRIIEDMGGTIDVESAVGEGSTFVVWMPAAGG